jgi:RNA polymerase sigma-70 factor (family 1)
MFAGVNTFLCKLMYSSGYNEELARRFNSGDNKALETVFNEHYRALWHFANSLIHDRWEAEDIVVETFLKLWKLRANFDTEQNIKAFLYITTRNACFNYLKHVEVRRYSHKELLYLNDEKEDEDLEDIIDCKIIESEVLREIILEIKSLPPKMGAIFEMIFVHGLSTAEISKKLKLSSATIRVQKAKAINTIRLALAKKRLLPALITLLLEKTIIHWFWR